MTVSRKEPLHVLAVQDRQRILLSLLPSGGRLFAQDAEGAGPGKPEGTTFYWENDSFLFRGTDRYYTNGLRLTRTYGADGLPRWAHRTRWIARIVDDRPLCSESDDQEGCMPRYQTAWTVGQNLYAPENLRASRLLRNQRPYGAWLYYGNILTLDKPGQQQPGKSTSASWAALWPWASP